VRSAARPGVTSGARAFGAFASLVGVMASASGARAFGEFDPVVDPVLAAIRTLVAE
jgi:hypothetical protein